MRGGRSQRRGVAFLLHQQSALGHHRRPIGPGGSYLELPKTRCVELQDSGKYALGPGGPFSEFGDRRSPLHSRRVAWGQVESPYLGLLTPDWHSVPVHDSKDNSVRAEGQVGGNNDGAVFRPIKDCGRRRSGGSRGNGGRSGTGRGQQQQKSTEHSKGQ